MSEKIAIVIVAVAVLLFAAGLTTLDSFMAIWTSAFVIIVKSALFAMLPVGLLFGTYVWLKEAFN